MSRHQKFLAQLFTNQNLQNIDFPALCNLLKSLGFDMRVRGSHHLFARPGIADLINLQPASGNTVKPYQVKQVRAVLLKHRQELGLNTID